MRRIPTKNQMERLKALANPDIRLVSSVGKPEWQALVKRGWLEQGKASGSLRITPAGLRALADTLEAYGRTA